MKAEPQFQIYQCSNPDCRFRCPNNLTEKVMQHCPICGSAMLPQGQPFVNQKHIQRFNSLLPNIHPQIEVILDNLRSTLNVGSIFRTADGVGIRHIYCCGTTPTPEHPKIARTALGAEEFISWGYRLNAVDLVNEKIQAGYLILSLEATENSLPIHPMSNHDNYQPILLVVGNEVSGVDPAILSSSDQILFIPMVGKKTSLNVAVAFGIAVYTLFS